MEFRIGFLLGALCMAALVLALMNIGAFSVGFRIEGNYIPPYVAAPPAPSSMSLLPECSPVPCEPCWNT